MGELFIDINSDLGESPERLANGQDLELMRSISSANIACGGHAGDEGTMKQTLKAARELKIAVGAHPSYPDRSNFGRVEMPLSPAELEKSVYEQIMPLAHAAATLGMRLTHVKPHGALYHAARDRDVAEAIGKAAIKIDRRLVMVGQAGSAALQHWSAMGLPCAAEAFADRAYERDGSLRNRNLPYALLDAADASTQAREIAVRRRVITREGIELPIMAETLCIHSDTPNAAAIAVDVKRRLTEAGFMVRPLVV
jgi:5-oxoprolinase (ATP-hydrolysing) subunit A